MSKCFRISKIIFGDTGLNDVIIDMDGDYAMTGMATGIKINSLTQLVNLLNPPIVINNTVVSGEIFEAFIRDNREDIIIYKKYLKYKQKYLNLKKSE